MICLWKLNLKAKGVKVLVSMQFGKNAKIINEHFIPIIIYSDQPEQVIDALNHHLHWISDELKKIFLQILN